MHPSARLCRTLARSLILVVAMALIPPSSTLAQDKSVRAVQGTLARWAGEGVDSCGMDGRTWKALADTCWYPIDFARPPGQVEIARWRGGAMEKAWLIIEKKDYETQEIDFPKEEYVHLSSEDLARHYAEQAEIKPMFRRRGGEALFTLPLGKPADPLPEGHYFAVHRVFNGEPKSRHTGIDYAIGLDNSTKSVADGTVIMTGDHFFSGKSVYVGHGDGLISMYFHLNDIGVEKGQEVKKGDEIGKTGSTGRSTGPHLHLGIRWRGARVDPNILLGDPQQVPAVE